MRQLALSVVLMLNSGCVFEFVHNYRARHAAAAVIGPCEDISASADRTDGWLWRAYGCEKECWCSYAKTTGEMACRPERPTDLLEAAARSALRCPNGPIAREAINPFEPALEETRWVNTELSGCGRTVWCGSNNDMFSCRQPADFDLAAAQLTVETQCATHRIEPAARQVFSRRVWIEEQRWIQMQISWRLNACGRAYVCAVTGGATPSITCKAALDEQQ